MPHIASPKARTGNDGAKNEMKIEPVNQAMKNIIVRRKPNLSLLNELMTKPSSSPTRAELARPDCHGADINFCFVPGS